MEPRPISLYNTLTQQIDPLFAMDGQRFRFYCCGPTVYGPAHIGNFRTFTLQDVLRRALEVSGYKPFHVRNLTDVDDKTIRQSQAEGKTLKAFTDHWARVFEEDCAALGLLAPHVEPSAVGHIPQQIAIIEHLIEKGHAYVGADGVYYKVASFPGYGALAHLDVNNLATQSTNSAGAANRADEYAKESMADFALWKAYRPEDGDNTWDSPWGRGRPGWHIECSAMCQAHLGDTIDLHGGGIDLIFPHHVNEMAQTEGATGKPFCRHWFHVAHLKVEGEKMSKSLGNLYTLKDLIKLGFSPRVVRYLLISGHYRQPLNFTFEGLHASQKALERLDNFVLGALALAKLNVQDWLQLGKTVNPGVGPFAAAWDALMQDLSTPQALGHLFGALKLMDSALKLDSVLDTLKSLAPILYVLGIELDLALKAPTIVPAAIAALAQSRWEAKAARDFAKADSLRAELMAAGWQVLDHPQGYTIEAITG